MLPKIKPQVSRILRWLVLTILFAVAAIGFSEAFGEAWSKANEQLVVFSWLFVVSWFLFAAAVVLSGILWGQILGKLEKLSIPAQTSARVHGVSWLLKYVPGQVGALIYKVAWAKRRGLQGGNAALSVLYENLFLQLASLGPGIIVLSINSDLLLKQQGGPAWALPFALVLTGLGALSLGPILRRARERLISKGYSIWANEPLTAGEVCRQVALFTMPRILNGIGFVLIVSTIAPVDSTEWLVLGAIYVVAGAIGILAIVVPSGLGVREGVIIALAGPVIGTSTAILAAVLARLVATAADVLVAVFAIGPAGLSLPDVEEKSV